VPRQHQRRRPCGAAALVLGEIVGLADPGGGTVVRGDDGPAAFERIEQRWQALVRNDGRRIGQPHPVFYARTHTGRRGLNWTRVAFGGRISYNVGLRWGYSSA